MRETNHQLVNVILNEDWVLDETIQPNLHSGNVTEVHFGHVESESIWFQEQYGQLLEYPSNAIPTKPFA